MTIRKITFGAILGLAIGVVGCDNGDGGGGDSFAGLNTSMDSVSYALGVDIGNAFKNQGWDIDSDALKAGFDAVSGEGAPLIKSEDARQIIMDFQREQQQAQQAAAGSENMAKGQQFLAENGAREGVKTLPNGLQYEVLQEGSGESPTLDDQVRIHYKGTLIDGTTFDSSYDRGEPAVFQPRGLIKAWQEILPMMKPGSKYKIFSPPDLAYGEFGSPPRIGPNETLIFEMELFEVIKQ